MQLLTKGISIKNGKMSNANCQRNINYFLKVRKK